MFGRLAFATLGPLTLGLLFAAHSPPAHAADVTVVGQPGLGGAPSPGHPPGGTAGGPGRDATAITPPNSDPSNTANATGGAGGIGGPGIPTWPVSGSGGVGGNAAATATTNAADSAGNGFASASATGGAGGPGGFDNPPPGPFFGHTGAGPGGAGGNATSNAIVINVPNASISATATGGRGGDCIGGFCAGGLGGSANVKHAASLATKSRSLPSQQAETAETAVGDSQ
jgi:hypothetical protein